MLSSMEVETECPELKRTIRLSFRDFLRHRKLPEIEKEVRGGIRRKGQSIRSGCLFLRTFIESLLGQREGAVQGARRQRDTARGRRRKGQAGGAGGRQGSHGWLLGQLWSLVLEVPQLRQSLALHLLPNLTVKPVSQSRWVLRQGPQSLGLHRRPGSGRTMVQAPRESFLSTRFQIWHIWFLFLQAAKQQTLS